MWRQHHDGFAEDELCLAVDTLLLDRSAWDLVTDANGNIAVASNPYSLAQDAASAIRLFQGECWYDTSKGVPYFTQVLGKLPPLAFVKSQFAAAALTVPEVASATVYITSLTGGRIVNRTTSNAGASLDEENGFQLATEDGSALSVDTGIPIGSMTVINPGRQLAGQVQITATDGSVSVITTPLQPNLFALGQSQIGSISVLA